jgi:hypothetical protein
MFLDSCAILSPQDVSDTAIIMRTSANELILDICIIYDFLKVTGANIDLNSSILP